MYSTLKPCQNLYPAFLNMARQFGHLKMLKRAGRGNSETGAAGTKEGELALLCPACPQPGINIPNVWDLLAAGATWYVVFEVVAPLTFF